MIFSKKVIINNFLMSYEKNFQKWANEILKENSNLLNNINIDIDDINIDIIPRKDWKHLPIYSIDPPNCTDADDAFTIYVENNIINLMIFIADPTAYFSHESELFKFILEKGQTLYLSGREPIHLFPEEILNKSSLTHGERKVIAVHSTFSMDFNLIESKVDFGIISCDNHNRFTYEEASNNIDNVLNLGLQLSKNLYNQRNAITFNNTIPIVENNVVIMKQDNEKVKSMKIMIAEFAIHANTIFANNLRESLFLRTLQLNDSVDNLSDLIKSGASAKYSSIKLPHDLLNKNEYTHATSPLRRASDCIVHFLLKSVYLNKAAPFTYEELTKYSQHLTNRTKYFKNIQFRDIKLRTFQWISDQINNNININISFKILNYKNNYLNLIITKINDSFDVNIPYTLKRNNFNYNYNCNYNKLELLNINIKTINIYNKFDEGTLPELDLQFI
jgi:exoribonuclease R